MSVRVFAPAEAAALQPGAALELDEQESRYLVKVRRARLGDTIDVFDNRGALWQASVTSLGRRVRVTAIAPHPARDLSHPRVLLLGLPDAAATLEALTGACELGATQVVFIRCARSQAQVPSTGRVERVLRAAMRQCGRPSPPTLFGAPPGDPWTLAQALAHQSELPGVFGDPEASAAPSLPAAGVRLLVGPEGGLCAHEVEAARAASFVGVRLGPWILRTPTAVVALLARFGDLAAPGS